MSSDQDAIFDWGKEGKPDWVDKVMLESDGEAGVLIVTHTGQAVTGEEHLAMLKHCESHVANTTKRNKRCRPRK